MYNYTYPFKVSDMSSQDFIDFIDIRAGRDLGKSSSPAPCPKGKKSAGVIGSQQHKLPIYS